MAITDEIAALTQPQQQQGNWLQDLINTRLKPKTPFQHKQPVGFNFTREPFDPSSYYKSLGSLRDISRSATEVSKQEAYNRQAAAMAASQAADKAAVDMALQGIHANYTYSPNSGGGHNYGLRGITSNTSAAANYFGSRYGIKNIGGYREHGSVPGSDHPKGRALDFMTSNYNRGTALANDVIRNYKKWNVKYVIWYRYIWSPGRGWRRYNGPSAHTDHVHVSFNK